MTFLEAKQKLARRRNADAASLNAVTAARYADFINESHRALLRMPGMEALRHATMTFASSQGFQAYTLPEQGIARINRIWETTNDRTLEMKTLGWLRETDPDPQQGTPWAWIPTGYVEAHTQPTQECELFAKSSDAGTPTIYIEGYTTGGYYRTASVALTGTTPVSLGAAITTWIRITKCYLSAATVGVVTVHSSSGIGNELVRISIGDVRARYYEFLLHDIPSGTVTYTCDVLRAIPNMSNDTDEFLLPDDFHDLVVDMAELKEVKKSDDPNRYAMLSGLIKDGKRDLAAFMTAHPGWTPDTDAMVSGRSRLGPWYPSGS
jgi:hypothetical protein